MAAAGSDPSAAAGATTDEHEQAMWAGSNNILVVIRVRPMNEKERKSTEDVISVVDGKLIIIKDPGHHAENLMRQKRIKDRRYAFDHAFDSSASQERVYALTTRFLVDGVLNGFNATVFAYGATGSGKTFTMLGAPACPGIMVLTLQDLYASIEVSRSEGREVRVSLSYVEVYNENIRDLLSVPSEDESEYLDIREDPIKGPCVSGVSEHDVECAEDVMDLLSEGNKRRTQEPTAANKESSRSHAVLQILVESKESFGTAMKTGKLSLIDLAGSERAANTQNRGIRLLEGANINRSLLALGNCITALVQAKGSFVPYRDSKLTRLLKDSLGGNTRTVMIGCAAPGANSFEETLNTLKYCDRAKRIKTNITRNVLTVSYHISEYENLISGLRAEVANLKSKLAGLGSPTRPISSLATVRQLAAAVGPTSPSMPMADFRAGVRPSSRLAAAGAAAMSASGGGAGGDAVHMRHLREALVFNFQEQMQLRRSLAELQAQNVENSVEIGKRQVSVARWEHAEAERSGDDTGMVPLGSSSGGRNPVDTATAAETARKEINELQSSINNNSRLKDDLLDRLAENDKQGSVIRSELEKYGTSDDLKELLALEYRVCLLELEKVELEQSGMLYERTMQQREMEIRKLRLQLRARDRVIAQQAELLDKHNLGHLMDHSALLAMDGELAMLEDDDDNSVSGSALGEALLPPVTAREHFASHTPSGAASKPKAPPVVNIWSGYSGNGASAAGSSDKTARARHPPLVASKSFMVRPTERMAAPGASSKRGGASSAMRTDTDVSPIAAALANLKAGRAHARGAAAGSSPSPPPVSSGRYMQGGAFDRVSSHDHATVLATGRRASVGSPVDTRRRGSHSSAESMGGHSMDAGAAVGRSVSPPPVTHRRVQSDQTDAPTSARAHAQGRTSPVTTTTTRPIMAAALRRPRHVADVTSDGHGDGDGDGKRDAAGGYAGRHAAAVGKSKRNGPSGVPSGVSSPYAAAPPPASDAPRRGRVIGRSVTNPKDAPSAGAATVSAAAPPPPHISPYAQATGAARLPRGSGTDASVARAHAARISPLRSNASVEAASAAVAAVGDAGDTGDVPLGALVRVRQPRLQRPAAAPTTVTARAVGASDSHATPVMGRPTEPSRAPVPSFGRRAAAIARAAGRDAFSHVGDAGAEAHAVAEVPLRSGRYQPSASPLLDSKLDDDDTEALPRARGGRLHAPHASVELTEVGETSIDDLAASSYEQVESSGGVHAPSKGGGYAAPRARPVMPALGSSTGPKRRVRLPRGGKGTQASEVVFDDDASEAAATPRGGVTAAPLLAAESEQLQGPLPGSDDASPSTLRRAAEASASATVVQQQQRVRRLMGVAAAGSSSESAHGGSLSARTDDGASATAPGPRNGNSKLARPMRAGAALASSTSAENLDAHAMRASPLENGSGRGGHAHV